MIIEQSKSLIRRWVEAGWNKGNLAVVDDVYAPNVVQHDPSSPMPVNSAEALKMYAVGYLAAFPDLRFSIDELIGEGDWRQRRLADRYRSMGNAGSARRRWCRGR
jgi:hypothetical protein